MQYVGQLRIASGVHMFSRLMWELSLLFQKLLFFLQVFIWDVVFSVWPMLLPSAAWTSQTYSIYNLIVFLPVAFALFHVAWLLS